jgi:hypothetical protein
LKFASKLISKSLGACRLTRTFWINIIDNYWLFFYFIFAVAVRISKNNEMMMIKDGTSLDVSCKAIQIFKWIIPHGY